MMPIKVKNVQDLRVFRSSFEASMEIFELSKSFPFDERYSLTDQIRRSSRSICANLAEAWRKRFYKAHFISKLSDCAAEAEETRVWLKFAFRCEYLDEEKFAELDSEYDKVIAQLVTMMSKPENWTLR